jgi:hypothetical protein
MIFSTAWVRLVLSPASLHSVSSVATCCCIAGCLQRRGYAWPCHLPHCTRLAAWRRAVALLGTVAVPNEWSIALALCYNHTVATRMTGLPTQSC